MAASDPTTEVPLGRNKDGVETGTTGFEYVSVAVPSDALFVAADEPLLIYPSVAAAESHLEAIDVQDGTYPAAYGPNGETYRIYADGDHVSIEPTGDPDRPDELDDLLRQYFKAIGRTPHETATFDELVATAWAIKRGFWREHHPYGGRFGTRLLLWRCIGFAGALAAVLHLVFR